MSAVREQPGPAEELAGLRQDVASLRRTAQEQQFYLQRMECRLQVLKEEEKQRERTERKAWMAVGLIALVALGTACTLIF